MIAVSRGMVKPMVFFSYPSTKPFNGTSKCDIGIFDLHGIIWPWFILVRHRV